MSIQSNAGLREVKLRYGIRRLSLVTGTDMPPHEIWYTYLRKAHVTCDTLNFHFKKILHTVEEVELNPED